MQMTLLDMVQDILSALSDDKVDTISDTVESDQITRIIKRVYNQIISSREWPHLRKIIQIEASGSSSYPSHMSVLDVVSSVKWIKYDKRTATETKRKYIKIDYLDPEDFMDYINGRDNTESTVDLVVDYDGAELLIKNDAHPTVYTSFDNKNIVFDSYDNTTGATLLKARTQAETYQEAAFSSVDTFVPDLPDKAFDYLLNESLSLAFLELKQLAHVKAEKSSKDGESRLSAEKHRIGTPYTVESPDYGRK